MLVSRLSVPPIRAPSDSSADVDMPAACLPFVHSFACLMHVIHPADVLLLTVMLLLPSLRLLPAPAPFVAGTTSLCVRSRALLLCVDVDLQDLPDARVHASRSTRRSIVVLFFMRVVGGGFSASGRSAVLHRSTPLQACILVHASF